MTKSLVIVESPAKAKTINKYLGKDFIVKSSVGHIRDLPTSGSAKPVDPKARAAEAAKTRKMTDKKKVSYKKQKAQAQLIKRMGIDPDNDWAAQYQVLPGKEKVVSDLQLAASKVDAIYLATDLDREGEAIAWHLREEIGGDLSQYKRVVFNEITEKAVKAAFEKPVELNIDRVNAQQARRFLDRVVGFMVSPLLWAKVARGLSAGRVQSVSVKLLVERECEIRAFVPEEYWDLFADLATQTPEMCRFQVGKYKGSAYKPVNEEQIQEALEHLRGEQYKITARDDRKTQSRPSAPYITSTLQQAASTRLGFGVKKTMTLAQKLYEAGHITYMRTDSTSLSADAVASCRDYIVENFSKAYLPTEPISYSSKKGAQEAHEAIRPSNVSATPTRITGLERDVERLYTLIWNQFVACQMTPAEFTNTTVAVTAGDYELKAKGRIIRFDGYLRVQAAKANDKDVILPDMKVGDLLNLNQLEPKQHFTKPPPRFSEAGLVKELEKQGIGRPSTYAAIISTIQDRGYVSLKNKRFHAEKMGDIITDRLSESFSELMDYGFTANLEKSLDGIAEGKQNWKDVLNDFYRDFSAQLQEASEAEGGMRPNVPVETDIACPTCERNMQIRTASTGVFLGCSGYALPPKERCKQTINLTEGEEAIAEGEDDEAESRLLISKHRCEFCNSAMDQYLIDENRKLHVCGNSPDCLGYEVETGLFKIKGYDGPIIECDKCTQDMELRTGRFGKYFGCTNDNCKNTRKLLRSGEAAPPKMDPIDMPDLACVKVEDHYVLRDGASGMFLAASKFPKNRETRAPCVDEVLPVKDQLDVKYTFLLSAPLKDPDGNRSIIRFSRKSKEQYVMTEVDSKATGWRAFFRDNKWVEELAKKPKPKAAGQSKAKAKPKAKTKTK
ncbi:MAG: type I DNA topoisomerase [Pseudomonadales bacterium]|nr:type I DNA topoisomerase [Pseudomonadales bacterium]